jgi:dinuclear metal center YbgI/SA1388 family protein
VSTTVRDVARWLDAFAPPSLAESWDNVGLLWGDPDAPVTRVMTCLTVTPRTAAEAVAERAELIVSHHPVLFRAVKRVVAGDPAHGMLWPLARAGVSVLSPHTAFDNTEGGINDGLARRLGLVEVGPLRPSPPAGSFKVVVFTPEADHEAVLAAAFGTGAGRIGAYRECSFATPGEGTFFGGEGASPAVGQAGRRETVRELRVEMVCPADRLADVLASVRSAHSYEEPAIDVYPLHPSPGGPGAGRLGRLPAPTTLEAFARAVGQALNATGLSYVGEPGRAVGRVAIVCGAGDDFLADAARAGADVLLTGEARFHRALEAESLGVGLVVAGHHATERPGVEDLAARLAGDLPGLTVWPSQAERDPLVSPGPSAAGSP